MARIKVRKEIDIHRNVIEQSLMNVKDFLKTKRKIVLIALVSLLVLFVVAIGVFVYIETVSTNSRKQYEKIMDNYNKKLNDVETTDKTIKDLEKLAKSSIIGFAHEMCYYSLGNIYYDKKDFAKAKSNLLIFARKNSTVFSQLAQLKAAIAASELKNTDEALKILKKLEDEDSQVVADQLNYYLAQVYQKKGNLTEARRYLNNVISKYPRSPYAQRAKKNLFLLGLNKK